MAREVRNVAQYCYQCVAGPDLLTVRVEDGVATQIEPNLAAAKVHPGGFPELRHRGIRFEMPYP